MEKKLFCNSIEEIPSVAKEIISFAGREKVWLFYGQLGAGKTTFIQQLCRLKGVEKEVTSPTFSLVNEYQGRDEIIYHFDFYRLRKEEEALDIGIEEYLDSGNLCLIEWPEKVSNLLPPKAVKIKLSLSGQTRNLILENPL